LNREPRILFLTSPREAAAELERIGTDPYGIQAMAPKAVHVNLLLSGLECRAANVLKQEMLSIGGDVAVSRGSVSCSVDSTDALIMGTRKQVSALAAKLSAQPFGLREISKNISAALANLQRESFALRTPRRELAVGERTLVMGILNVTPDSFSDGGRYDQPEAAVERALRLEDEGADILDIGGESTRPGSGRVPVEEELARVIPVLEKLSGRISIPVSIDTMKAEVARQAVRAGAEIINDVSALGFDPEMARTAAGLGTPVILMHMRGEPETMQQGDLSYASLLGDIISFLRQRVQSAVEGGIDPENIIIDPGFGFGKSPGDNLKLLKRLREFKILGKPLLIGVSRKAFTGRVTAAEDSVRLEGGAAAVTAAILNGANIIRVHDVGFMKKTAMMADAILRS
jgi:dihydropteroate synthase